MPIQQKAGNRINGPVEFRGSSADIDIGKKKEIQEGNFILYQESFQTNFYFAYEQKFCFVFLLSIFEDMPPLSITSFR